MRLRWTRLWAALCLAVAGAATAGAQVGGGQITGMVTDVAGAAVPGATVVAVNLATASSRQTVSTAAGVFTLAGLSPGTYRVDVALSGFRPVRRQGIRIETGETVRLDFELAVGGVSERVTVTADAPLQRATASLGQVVSEAKVAALPLNGRSFITLAALAPGVALPPASQLPRINGGRPRTNEYLFDGISVLQPEPGQVAFFPTIDAIQEFTIETNSPPAEFGRFNGGVVNLTTKSGTNAFHGSAFEFLRHEALNARNVFAATNAEKPEFRRNQFGGVLGGPIVRDRSFFFVDYQGQRQTIGRTVISTRAHGPAAAGHLHRSDRRTCAGHLRSGIRRDDAHAVCRRRHPCGSHRPGRPNAAGALPAGDLGGNRQQLPSHRAGDRRSEPVDGARRPSMGWGPRPSLRPADELPRHLPARCPAAGWERRHQRHARTAGHRVVGVRVALPAGVVGVDPQRGPRRRHAAFGRSDGFAARIHRGRGVEHPRYPGKRAVPQHPADVSHQRLSAARVSAEHGVGVQHQRDRDRRHADVDHGPPHAEGGIRLALGAAERRPAAVAHRVVHVQRHRQRSARRRRHRDAVRQLPPRAGAVVLDRPAAGADSGARQLPGVLRPGRLEGERAADDLAGPALHAELPLDGDQRADGGPQSGDAAPRVPGRCARPAAEEEQLRSASRRGVPRDRQDARQHRLRDGVDRDGGHHHAVHDADVSVPADGVAARARHALAGVRAAERSGRGADRADADGRTRSRRVLRGRDARIGLRAAVECVGAA